MFNSLIHWLSLYSFYVNIQVPLLMVLSLWFYDDHVGIMEYGLLSTWRDAYGVMWLFIFLSVAFALHLIHALAYGVMSQLAKLRPYRYNIVTGDMAFALHMYFFGLWHDGLGLRLWMSLWEAMLLQVWWLLIFTIYGVVSIVGRNSLLIVGVHINYASPKFGGY